MLEVMATATDESLTINANVKEALDVADSFDEQYFTRLIARSSGRIVDYLGRPLALTKYRAIMPAYGGITLQLPRYPVRDVLRVFDGTDTGLDTELTSTEYHVDRDRGWLQRDAGWPWTRQIEQNNAAAADIIVPNAEMPTYMVEFTAGYVMSGGLATESALYSTQTTSTGQTMPASLENAAIELTRSLYLGRHREAGVQSEQVGEVAVTYSGGAMAGMPESIQSILNPLRSI